MLNPCPLVIHTSKHLPQDISERSRSFRTAIPLQAALLSNITVFIFSLLFSSRFKKKKKKTCKEHIYNTGNINLHDFFSSDLSLFLSILSHQYSLDEGMKIFEVIYRGFLLSVPFTFRQKDFLFTEMWSLFWHLQLVDDFCFYCATRHSSSYQQAKVPFSVEVLDTFHVFCLLPSRAHQTFS